MQGNQIVYTFHVAGSAAANMTMFVKAYRAMTLQHVSTNGSNAHNATLAIGAGSAGTTALLAAFTMGVSDTPVTKTRSDFASTNATGAIAKDDLVKLTVDYDGAGGTAIDDMVIALTFTEG
jgi:hypothetical protein